MSRGSPTFTDSRRGMSLPVGWGPEALPLGSIGLFVGAASSLPGGPHGRFVERLGNDGSAIGAVLQTDSTTLLLGQSECQADLVLRLAETRQPGSVWSIGRQRVPAAGDPDVIVQSVAFVVIRSEARRQWERRACLTSRQLAAFIASASRRALVRA